MLNDIRDSVREFILKTYLPGELPESLSDDTPLQSSGILDSMAVMEVGRFLEERYDVRLGVHDTSVDRFDRIRDVAALVIEKRAQ